MNYTIKIDQQALAYIKSVLAQRPYAEVALLLRGLNAQQDEQDISQAVPVEVLAVGSLAP